MSPSAATPSLLSFMVAGEENAIRPLRGRELPTLHPPSAGSWEGGVFTAMGGELEVAFGPAVRVLRCPRGVDALLSGRSAEPHAAPRTAKPATNQRTTNRCALGLRHLRSGELPADSGCCWIPASLTLHFGEPGQNVSRILTMSSWGPAPLGALAPCHQGRAEWLQERGDRPSIVRGRGVRLADETLEYVGKSNQ
jgi:hypothetical protein